MGQFERAKELFKSQLDKVKRDISNNPDIRKLADAQFFEMEHEEHLYPQYFQMPESNRSNWKHMDIETRMIYVLCKSKAFSFEEIGKFLGFDKKMVWRIYQKTEKHLNQ